MIGITTFAKVRIQGLAESENLAFCLKHNELIDSTSVNLYKADVRFFGKDFGGLLLIKFLTDSQYRIVFTSETGIKFFDIGLHNASSDVLYMMDRLKKEKLIRKLVHYFQLLLWRNQNLKLAQTNKSACANQKIYTYKNRHKTIYYYCDSLGKQINRIEEKQILRRRTKLTLENYNNLEPYRIVIKDPRFHLKIELTKLQR